MSDSRFIIARNVDTPRAALVRDQRLVVGVVWGKAAWDARFAKVDGEVATLIDASGKTLAKWKVSPPPIEISKAFAAWQAEFFGFQSEWGIFKGSGSYVWATDSNDAVLQTFEKRILQLRNEFDKLPQIVQPATPPPPVYVPPADTTSQVVNSIATTAKWVAVGVIGYYGLRLVIDRTEKRESSAAGNG